MTIAPNTMVTPTVRLTRKLGSGGMGSVWRAEHLKLKADVAVKFISMKRLARDETLGVRFEREATIAAQLSSPHSVRVYDHGEMEDGTPYIVMEHLDGETLAERMKRAPLDADEIGEIVMQIARALTEAHDKGIVHRDLKPSNVYLAEAGSEVVVKVIDWGIAVPLERDEEEQITATDVTVGTPPYINPERLLDPDDVDPGADLWSLSVIAYEALTGRRPFKGKSAPAITLAICDRAYAHPSALSSLPIAVDAWFERAFHEERGARFSDAAELAAELRSTLSRVNEPLAQAVSPEETSTPPGFETTLPRRSGWAAAFIGLVTVMGLAYGFRATSERQPTSHVAPPLLRSSVPSRQSAASKAVDPLQSPPTIPSQPTKRTLVSPRKKSVAARKAASATPSVEPSSAPAASAAEKVRPAWCDTPRGLYYQDGRYHVPEACQTGD